MLSVLTGALLPVVVTIGLGLLAGWRGDFSGAQAALLNRMVMLYALPITLFSSVAAMPRAEIAAQAPLAATLFCSMMGPFLLAYFFWARVSKTAASELRAQRNGRAMILALSASAPSVPFVGVPVLGHLFGAQSGLIVSIGGLVINLVQVPLALIVLTHLRQARDASLGKSEAKGNALVKLLWSALKEPVVWAPLLALLCVLTGVRVPEAVRQPFRLLGQATGGTALFATGVILQSRAVKMNGSVLLAVLLRNVGTPLAVLGIFTLFPAYLTPFQQQETIVTLALPSAAIATILAVAFNTAEREAASVFFFSTLASLATLGGFLVLTRPL